MECFETLEEEYVVELRMSSGFGGHPEISKSTSPNP